MKRTSSLIDNVEILPILKKSLVESTDTFVNKIDIETKMYRNTIWYKSLLNAEKACLKEDKIKKIHYKFEDDKEMVEEYNVDTQVLIRRAWKVKRNLGGEGKWEVEVGDSIPDATPHIDAADICESKDQVCISFIEDNGENLL